MARSLDRPDTSAVPDQPDPGDAPRQLRSPPRRTERLSNLDHSDEIRTGDRPALTDHSAAPWSRDDLRNRLERLPPGHPSSPYRDQPPAPRDPDRRSPGDRPEQDLSNHPDNPTRQPDTVVGRYWHEVPRLMRAWEDHVRRWPAERAPAVDRSRDPAGSWRGDGNQYLDPEQHAQAKDAIARVRQSEPKLTEDITEIKQENTCGGWLEGMKFRLKGEDRLKEKIAEKVQHEPGRTPLNVVQQLSDSIRYTFCFEPASYADGYRDVKQRLEAREYRMIYSKNHWRDDPEYKGINTRWVTPEGQRFEVQFHTPESFNAKHRITHKSYGRLRNPLTYDDERQELREFQRDVCHWIGVPERVADIADYRKGSN